MLIKKNVTLNTDENDNQNDSGAAAKCVSFFKNN